MCGLSYIQAVYIRAITDPGYTLAIRGGRGSRWLQDLLLGEVVVVCSTRPTGPPPHRPANDRTREGGAVPGSRGPEREGIEHRTEPSCGYRRLQRFVNYHRVITR